MPAEFVKEKMKTNISFVSLILFLTVLSGCIGNSKFFHNKILIYSSESNVGTITNAAFIDFYEDTINKIDYPFELFDQTLKASETIIAKDTSQNKYLLPNIYPWSGVPFKFSREKNSIYLNYTYKNESIKKKYFIISKQDSVESSSFDYLCHSNFSDNWIVTKYTGDTTMTIFGKKIKCWVFEESYPHLFSPNQRSQIIYLDKKSLLPVQINTIYYRPDNNNPSSVKIELFKDRIDTIFKRPWNSFNKKWNYSKCWHNGQ